jgi:hypothetical protein
MSLAAGKAVLSLLQGPGANGGGQICNDTPDGAGDAPYTCSESNIDKIATAHCSIAANNKPNSDLTALRAGNYGNIASGPCGATCPSECACDSSNHCVAPWLGTKQTGDGGAGGMSAGGTSSGGGSTAGTSNGGTGTGGATSSGGAATSGGVTGFGGGAPSAGTTSIAGTTSSNGGASAAGSNGVSGGTLSGAGSSGDSSSDSNGCSCRAAGQSRSESLAGFFLACTFGGLGFAARARRRSRR